MWQLHTDGTSLPGSLRIGVGCVLTSPNGERFVLSRALNERGCSNEAEAHALLAGLELASHHGVASLRVITDNSILIDHTRGEKVTRVERLSLLFSLAKTRLARLAAVEMMWVPRHKNAEADALARAALGLPPKPSAPNNARRLRRRAFSS
jgi:ribonuclease HI